MNPPLLVVGIDAGDPGLIGQWAAQGRLPNIARLMRDGLWGRTAGPEMISEHGIWVTLTTGVPRREHGYYWFRQLEPGTYSLRPFLARDTGAHPFWTRLRSSGARVVVVDVPDCDPVAGLAGFQIANWAVHDPQGPPSAEPAAALSRFGRPTVIAEDPQSSLARDRRLFDRLQARLRRKTALCRALLAGSPPDFAFIVFGESHTGGHQFWKYRGRAGELGGALLDLYRGIDSAIGEFTAAYPAPPNVCVIGSVGLRDEWPSEGFLAEFCRRFGYAPPPAPGPSASRRPLDLLRGLIPQSARNHLSRLLSRETQERLLSDKFRHSLDWSRTTIFALPYFYMGLLRVNLRGREPDGAVNPGPDYHRLLDRVSAGLETLRDPDTGQPAVGRIHRAVPLFGPEPHPRLPDLFVEWTPSPHLRRRLVYPGGELLQPPPVFCRGSEHTQEGWFALAGPGIAARGPIGPIDPLSVAPTLSALCGGGSDGFAGRALEYGPTS